MNSILAHTNPISQSPTPTAGSPLFHLAGFDRIRLRKRTPTPPPFSSVNSTPAAHCPNPITKRTNLQVSRRPHTYPVCAYKARIANLRREKARCSQRSRLLARDETFRAFGWRHFREGGLGRSIVEEVVKASLENADLDRADAKEIKLCIGNHSGGAAEILRAA